MSKRRNVFRFRAVFRFIWKFQFVLHFAAAFTIQTVVENNIEEQRLWMKPTAPRDTVRAAWVTPPSDTAASDTSLAVARPDPLVLAVLDSLRRGQDELFFLQEALREAADSLAARPIASLPEAETDSIIHLHHYAEPETIYTERPEPLPAKTSWGIDPRRPGH